MKYGLALGVALLILFSGTTVLAFTFTRNLTIGSTGQDVLELQRTLNTNSATQVAESGPGSPGNETSYFGALTQNALIRYQNLFREEILEPVGLSYGTGYFGPSTRTHIHREKSTTEEVAEVTGEESGGSEDVAVSTTVSSPLNSFSSELANSEELYLFYPSSYEGDVGKKITLYGAGFESENTIFFGEEKLGTYGSGNNGTTITFILPDISYGYHSIQVENSKGKTNTDAFFIVKDPDTTVPKITSVSPEEGYYGETITVVGEGFVKENNQIRTSYGVVEGIVSEDGTTLEFSIRPFPDTPGIEEGVDLGRDVSWDISLNVINGNGISNRKIFTLEF